MPKIETERYLQTIDQHFTQPLAVLPTETAESVVFPQQVGVFQRSSADTYAIRNIEAFLHSDLNNHSEQWLNWKYTSPTNLVTVDAWLNPDSLAAKEAFAGPAPCAAELGGEQIARTSAKIPYGYHVCYAFMAPGEQIDDITWRNGAWIIFVAGNVDGIIEFLKDYPY
ncbi:MAG TPA: hypothetical protein VMT34_08760 [Aggregatilineales bacterium]|nr:hypothetical protein [Aggregatilineales bacterium]